MLIFYIALLYTAGIMDGFVIKDKTRSKTNMAVNFALSAVIILSAYIVLSSER